MDKSRGEIFGGYVRWGGGGRLERKNFILQELLLEVDQLGKFQL